MHNVGRNEPCPCGSGRKFKKCCMGAGSKAQSRLTALGKIGRFVNDDALLPTTQRLCRDFYGEYFDVCGAGSLDSLTAAICEATMVPWVYFDARTESSKTLAEMFLETNEVLNKTEIEFMRQMMKTTLRLYRVLRRPFPGGLEVEDVWTRDVSTASERDSEKLDSGEFFFGRLRPRADDSPLAMEGGVLRCNPHCIVVLEQEALMRTAAGDDQIELLKARVPSVFQNWFRLHHNPKSGNYGISHKGS
ncbi:MAG: hypothetical protein GY854_22545 [Deltaproteobacteria bacterium]|nr:hypothetical protein [Deltaproteobacteria bacterium]